MPPPNLDLAIKNMDAYDLAPVIRGIYSLESSSGSAKTSKSNRSGARGPMQVTKQTFNDMMKRNLIPKNYTWSNPQHSMEAGVAYVKYLRNHFDTPKADELGALYYGGPSVVTSEGINMNRRDPKHPTFPTTGEYGRKLWQYVEDNHPEYNRSMVPAEVPAPAPTPAPATPWWKKLIGAQQPDITMPEEYSPGGRQKLI